MLKACRKKRKKFKKPILESLLMLRYGAGDHLEKGFRSHRRIPMQSNPPPERNVTALKLKSSSHKIVIKQSQTCAKLLCEHKRCLITIGDGSEKLKLVQLSRSTRTVAGSLRSLRVYLNMHDRRLSATKLCPTTQTR
jgi:hypothetical protein